MGKSGGRKKKGSVNQTQNQVSSVGDKNLAPNVNGGVDLSSLIFLKRANELKEEGNKRFQAKDYVGALQQYENALKLIPKSHPERAVFHSNRAACLMQMRPVDYESVISECSLALQVQPVFVRALLRRARAYEAMGKYDMAMQDIQSLLGADPNHGDALEISRRLRAEVGPQQDLHSRPSPAALGASAVRGAPIAGLGPCLPARTGPKKPSTPPIANNKPDKPNPLPTTENGPEIKTQFPKLVLKPSNGSSSSSSSKSNMNLVMDNNQKERSSSSLSIPGQKQASQPVIKWRSLKFVYSHDIRLAQMPINCRFKELREIVAKRFPSSKSVLIKYRDNDDDLVTITCTSELRLAELSVDKDDSIGMLRLHIVEVGPDQEPPLLEEEEEEEEKPLENDEIKGDESVSRTSSPGDSVLDISVLKDKTGISEDPEGKEVEMDDWLFEFAQLFRTHVGIDPDTHIDLHELGMELCSEALEETVTSEDAQELFEKAALKFQEVAALAFFNWGNVHMCAARKRIPVDESASKEVVSAQLQVAYDWVKDKYGLAKEKYEEALLIKPDFYEGLLALGQQQFEMAKLHWSFVLAKKEDISKWDYTETIKLFDSAEEKMNAATKIWEKLEEQRSNDVKETNSSKKEEFLKRKKKQETGQEIEDVSAAEEAAEQAAVMRSQIHLFWGNMLFERSQVECKLGFSGWKKNLDTAVERFKLAGASETDISLVMKNHCSNGDAVVGTDAAKEDEVSQVSGVVNVP